MSKSTPPIFLSCFSVLLLLAVSSAQVPPQSPVSTSSDWQPALMDSLNQMADHLTNTLVPWTVPNQTFPVEDFGAVADGKTINTTAIQKAIDACSAKGGGVVLLNKGEYVTGTLVLKSGVMLEVAKDAKLLGSKNLADYPAKIPVNETVMDTWMKLRLSLIYAENCEHIGIRGEGMIDGRGEIKNFPGKASIAELPGRPFLLRIIDCKSIVIDGIHLRDAASWMENYLNCDDLILQNVNVENQGNLNNDGFDIDGCHNVIVRNCVFNAEDDSMCFKGAGLRTMENVLVENCKAYSTCNALKFGTDSQGGFRNVLIRNMEVGGVPPGWPRFPGSRSKSSSGIAWETVDGGTLENIVVSQTKIVRSESPFFLRVGDRGRVKPGMPKPAPGNLMHIVFDQITGEDNGEKGSIIAGTPGTPIQDVVFENVIISMAGGSEKVSNKSIPEDKAAYPDAGHYHKIPASGFWIRHANRIRFNNVSVIPAKPDKRPEYSAQEDTSDITLDGKPLGDLKK